MDTYRIMKTRNSVKKVHGTHNLVRRNMGYANNTKNLKKEPKTISELKNQNSKMYQNEQMVSVS